MSRLKTQLVEQIFALGHGNVEQTQLLLEAVLDDRLVRAVAPRFDVVDDGGEARRIVDGVHDFVVTLKLPSKGGTYTCEAFLELETLAFATAKSGGGGAIGLPRSFLLRKEDHSRRIRRGRRKSRKNRLNRKIAWRHWHSQEISRLDSFSKGLVTTPECSRRSVLLMCPKECYKAFLKSAPLLEERERLRRLGHKGWAKAFSYFTYLSEKCHCIIEPRMRSCVCQKCQQLEYYLAAGHERVKRRHKAQCQVYASCSRDEKIMWIAPDRAFACAALRP